MTVTTTTSRLPLRPLALLVFVVLVAGAIASALVVRGVVDDQEERQLRNRTGEGALLLQSFIENDALPVLANVLAVEATSAERFESIAGPFAPGENGSIAVIAERNGSLVVDAAIGHGLEVGSALSGRQAAVVRRATPGAEAVNAVVGDHEDGRRHVGFALRIDDSRVLYQEVDFNPTEPLQLGAFGAFSELDGAAYASPRADPATLILTTTNDLPLSGTLERRTIPIGANEWLLVTTATEPLVGTFASNAWWLILATGLLAAVLTTALVEIVARRRRYAVRLVDERTRELRETLDELAELEQEARQARQAAETANRSKSEFLSRMSHELRTPLNAVLGFAQLLELEELAPPQRESVGQILKGGRHLLELINEVLDITRIETGDIALSSEPVAVGEVVTETFDLLRSLADEAGIQMVGASELPPDVHVLADRQRLKQILLNVVGNAVKYNRPGGAIAVSCDSIGDRVRINVADTGRGIRAEDIPKLFVAFERLGAEHTGIVGAGVGLALSRRLAEAMGGTIDVTSTVGEGSTFRVELPWVEGPVERYRRTAPPGEDFVPAGPGEHRHVLLYIEDNLSNLRLIERILEPRPDIVVIPAMQGRLGLELAREHRPAVILLDLHLPDVGGDDVLRRLRADPVTASTPVIVLSADATPGQVDRLLAEGATAFLTKPLDVNEFRRLLDQTMSGQR